MILLFFSFIAGVVTILSPCVITVLPVVLGGSVTSRRWSRPLVIITSLAISVFAFTLLLRASTILLGVPNAVWQVLAGGIITLLGVFTLLPDIWTKLQVRLGLSSSADSFLNRVARRGDILGAILTGAALGPVFTSCSPTYGYILGTVIQRSWGEALVHLFIYTLGLASMLMLVAVFGQQLVQRAKWAVDPNGLFRKILGLIFILIGIAVMFGIDKQIEAYFVQNGYLGSSSLEKVFIDANKEVFEGMKPLP